MTALQNILPFFVAFGVLVIFHEFGHYLAARLCGVKVLRFSVGWGRVIYSRKLGADQTEWAISQWPIGGYVKMLDERDQDLAGVSEADLKREFTRQSVWRRMIIIAAGPFANFLLAIILLGGLYMHGVPELTTRLHGVEQKTAAYDAGLRGDERITSVNGESILSWPDLQWKLMQSVLDKKPAELAFERPAESGASGIKQGRSTMAVGSLSDKDMEGDFMGKLGLTPFVSSATISEVVPGGPAQHVGLRQGDTIIAIDGVPVPDLVAASKLIRAAPNKEVQLRLLRDGQQIDVKIVTDSTLVNKVPMGQIKVVFRNQPETVVITRGPIDALGHGVVRTWEMSVLQATMIGKMLIGKLSWKNVSGLITIADYAGQSARAGLMTYVNFIALISISIGVMNLLPIPVLDGGLLLYYSLEVLTGRPIPKRFGEIAQVAGLGMLIALMVVAFFNDAVRYLT